MDKYGLRGGRAWGTRTVCVLGLAALGAGAAPAGSESPVPADFGRIPQAAPPNPPWVVRESAEAGARTGLSLAGPGIHSIGEPTDEEQLYVEYMNRSRANPSAEAQLMVSTQDSDILAAYKFFNVDLAKVVSDYALIAAVPPVSINARLTDAARKHSRDMFENNFQGHDGTDGSNPGTRITAAGYTWQTYGENVYASADSVWYGHAGFEVDWGNGPGGVQNPPGHRNTIHNAIFREVGVGVVLGSNKGVGPQLVTQDFSAVRNATPFVTGVVYYDLNGNQFYDLGEGLGGVTVRVSGTSTYAVTARSGGYSVPVAGNGNYQVTFEVPGLAPVVKQTTVAATANVKVDHVPAYTAPVLGGSSVATVGRSNPYVFSPVGGATSYDWRSLRRTAWTKAEGAETGFGRLTATISAGYNAITAGAKQAGNWSFHLAMPKAENQYLGTTLPIRLGAGSELSFGSRLGWASAAQVARAQISADDGLSWTDLWTQAGTGTAGERTFTTRTASLAAYAGKTVRIRFAYTMGAGSYFNQIDATVGWCLDEILVSNAEDLTDEITTAVAAGNGFDFVPAVAGGFLLQVRPRVGDRVLPWGPALAGTAEVGSTLPAVVRLDSLVPRSNGGELLFTLQQGSPATLEIEMAASPVGPWSKDAGAAVATAGAAGKYRATLGSPAGAPARFYRVVAR